MRRIALIALVAGALCLGWVVGSPELPAHAAQTPDPLALAVDQVRAGRYSDAIATLETAIRANPKTGERVYLLLAQLHTERADAGPGIDVLRGGLRAYPAAPALERALGQLLFRTRYDSGEAGTLLARAAKLLPRDPEARHYYAQWAYLNGRERICVAEEDAALALPGLNDLAELQMNTLLGLCHGRLSGAASVDGARRAFARAHDINTRQAAFDPIAALHYVQFLLRHGDAQPAQAIVEQILTRAPRFGPARLEAAKHHDRSGDCGRAIEAARMALASDGIDANSERAAHLLMARCHAQLGNTEEAEKEQRWIEAHPNPETPRKPVPGA